MSRKRNRHGNKMYHKRIMEKKYANSYMFGTPCNVRLLRDKLEREAQDDSNWWIVKHPPRNNGWEYWQMWDMTGMRQYAKKFSDKRIRQKYRIMLIKEDPEDIVAPRGSDYEKEYDYAWTIW